MLKITSEPCDRPNLSQYFGGLCPHDHFLRGNSFGKKIPPPLTFSSGDCLWNDISYPKLKNAPFSKFYFWEKVLFSGVVT
jgi:hypothetical protein